MGARDPFVDCHPVFSFGFLAGCESDKIFVVGDGVVVIEVIDSQGEGEDNKGWQREEADFFFSKNQNGEQERKRGDCLNDIVRIWSSRKQHGKDSKKRPDS